MTNPNTDVLSVDELFEYIDSRIDQLNHNQSFRMESEPPEKREEIRQQFLGRKKELKKLKTALSSSKIETRQGD